MSNQSIVMICDGGSAPGINIKSRPVELEYKLSCCRPIGYGLTLCTLPGIGVKKMFDEGVSGCIVTTNSRGDIKPMFLLEFENGNGVIPPRLVDIKAEISKLSFKNLHYLEAADLAQISQLVANPQGHEFNKILNWN